MKWEKQFRPYRDRYRRLMFKISGIRDWLLSVFKRQFHIESFPRALRKRRILNNAARLFRLRWPIVQFDLLQQLINESNNFFSIVFNGCVTVIKCTELAAGPRSSSWVRISSLLVMSCFRFYKHLFSYWFSICWNWFFLWKLVIIIWI